MNNLIVAIDGPAGAGKSTVAQLAAKELGCTYIDTGAMYRAVAWKTLQQGKPVTDELIVDVVKDIHVELAYKEGKTIVTVDGTDVTGEPRRLPASFHRWRPWGLSAAGWWSCSAAWRRTAPC